MSSQFLLLLAAEAVSQFSLKVVIGATKDVVGTTAPQYASSEVSSPTQVARALILLLIMLQSGSLDHLHVDPILQTDTFGPLCSECGCRAPRLKRKSLKNL